MTERELRQAEMDSLLLRSQSAPVPSLPRDFDQRVTRKALEIRRGSQPRILLCRILLNGYGLTSAVASVVVMRGQGFHLELYRE